MRTLKLTLLTLALALTTAACADKPEKKLIGKWGMDAASMTSSEKFKAMPAEQQEFTKKMAEEMAAKMVFEFKEGGKISMSMGDKAEEGEWAVKSVDGDKLTIHTKGGKDGKEEDQVVTFKGNNMVMTMNGEEVTFIRK